MKTSRNPIRPGSVLGKLISRLRMKVEKLLPAVLDEWGFPNFSLLTQDSEEENLKKELSALLKDAMCLHKWIQNEGASSRVLTMFVAQIESAIAALGESEGVCRRAMREAKGVWKKMRIFEAKRLLLGECDCILSELVSFMMLEFDFMRRELGLLPSEEDPWEEFKLEVVQVYAVVVSAVALLLLVYHYLAGYIDRGGTKTYSPGSFEFRSTYVSIVLFQGAYVWIKFRDVASSIGGGYHRRVIDKLSGTIKLSDKCEARYTPPRGPGSSNNHNHIYLGMCVNNEEAKVKKRIAACCYRQDLDHNLYFDNDRSFLIPPMVAEQGLSDKEKRAWVKTKVKEVYGLINASIDLNTAHLLDHAAIRSPPRSPPCSPPALTSGPVLEGPSGAAIDSEFTVEGHLAHTRAEDPDYCEFLETFLDSSEDMPSDLLDGDPQQHLQDNHVQDREMAVPTLDNQCDNSSDFEPLATGGSDSILEDVHGSYAVAEGGLTIEDAPDYSQVFSEFPPVGSVGLQQHSDAPHNPQPVSQFPSMGFVGLQQCSNAMADIIDLCPGSSTSDVLVLSHFVEQVREKERVRVTRHFVQQIQEKDKRIVELERENERLGGASCQS